MVLVTGVGQSCTVTVSQGTRATVDEDLSTLRFAEGDKLSISGTNISGVLNMTSAVGETTATFSGNLTYTGTGDPADDLSLTATLVSAQQSGTELTYPTNAYCATVEEAVKKYSRLTGTGTYGSRSFQLSQGTAFLNFKITFVDGTTTGTTLPAVFKNNGTELSRANVTTTTENGKVVAKFVLPVAGGTTLTKASVKFGDKGSVVINNATVTGKVYNVNKKLGGFSINANDAGGLFSNNLIIYGQSVDNGTLTASAPWSGIHTNNNLTINGGIISATSTTSTGLCAGDDLTINRGSITAHGHYDGMRGQNIIINGGIVNATNGEGSNSYGIKANLDITLGYTELTDRITASSYKSYDGTISVKAGQALYDGTAAAYSGTLNSTQIDAIAGKTLEPCFILTLPELVNATGVISQEDTTAYALAGAEITLAAAEGYEITDGTTSFTMPAQNVVSDVTVQVITYNISYDLAGGSVATANPTTYHIETATFTLNNPTRTGSRPLPPHMTSGKISLQGS